MRDFTIVSDNSPMTFDKVMEFVDCLPISKMDMHELKSRIADYGHFKKTNAIDKLEVRRIGN